MFAIISQPYEFLSAVAALQSFQIVGKATEYAKIIVDDQLKS